MGLPSCTPAMQSSWSCTLTPASSASSLATRTRWVLPSLGVAHAYRLHNFSLPASSPGLCPGTGWKQLSSGLSPGTDPQHATPMGLPEGGLSFSVPEPCPYRLLPQVGEGPLRWVGASHSDTDHFLHIYSFSNSGTLLCGVGKDHHGRTVKGQPGELGQSLNCIGSNLPLKASPAGLPLTLQRSCHKAPIPRVACVLHPLWMKSTFI